MFRRAFSLLEVLVVTTILAILAGLALTGIQKARHSANRADCQNRLRNQAAAVLHFESREGRLPPGSISGPYARLNVPEGINHGFWTVLLAELDQPAAASQYHWNVNFDDSLNQAVVNLRIEALLCPALNSDRIETWPAGYTARIADFAPVEVNAFLADIGLLDPSENFDGVMPVNGSVRLNDIADGASNTLLLVEAAGRAGMAWSSPDLLVSVRSILGGEAHQGGANAALCDGSIRFFPAGTEIRLLARLATRGGKESVD